MLYLGTHTRARVSAGHQVLLQAGGTLGFGHQGLLHVQGTQVLSFLSPPA